LGVLGGSFDPPHCGHVLLATYALSVAPIDGLLIVPTFDHAFGKPLTSFEHRVEMCNIAFGFLRNVDISRIEEELEGPSYTVRTLEALRSQRPGIELRLVIGADLLGDVHRWKEFERVRELAPPFVVGRAGYERGTEANTLDLPEVSSTLVRERLRLGEAVSGLVPRAVESYCHAHSLYLSS
jgi:nicotinate-nucleotide adenylyltransferase